MTEPKTILQQLEEPFEPSQVRTRQGRGGISLKWVDARTVAARMDAVLGLDGWEWTVERQQDGVVLGRLTVHLASGKSITREDFGYMTGGSGEDLKEAATDCLRRCASLFGVGRYLYQHGADVAAAAALVVDEKVAEAAERIFGSKQDVAKVLGSLTGEGDGGACPQHRLAWTLKPAGVSKAGKAYAPFYTCSQKNADGSFCSSKPSLKWLSAHNPNSEPKVVSQEMDDIPF
jgi:hypothetical protein